MKQIQKNRKNSALVFFFTMTYLVSYLTRVNYGAIISEIEASTGFTKPSLSMAVTGSFLTYGVGQVFSGLLGDRCSPRRLIQFGLLATSLFNLTMTICRTPIQFCVIWSINGFAQAFLWPPLIKIMASQLSGEAYVKATVWVSWGSALGSIAVYLISPLLIAASGWRLVFFSAAACSLTMSILWKLFKFLNTGAAAPESRAPKAGSAGIGSIPGMLFVGIMLASVFHGILKDSVMTWMPSMLAENYHIQNEWSILISTISPIFSMFCFYLTSVIYRKWVHSPVTCACAVFLCSSLAAGSLLLTIGTHITHTVISLALLYGCMNGINLLFISILPTYFRKQGRTSTVTGILNACTYLGSAVSTYGVAILAEQNNWNLVLIIWLSIAVGGACMTALCIGVWNKRMPRQPG